MRRVGSSIQGVNGCCWNHLVTTDGDSSSVVKCRRLKTLVLLMMLLLLLLLLLMVCLMLLMVLNLMLMKRHATCCQSMRTETDGTRRDSVMRSHVDVWSVADVTRHARRRSDRRRILLMLSVLLDSPDGREGRG